MRVAPPFCLALLFLGGGCAVIAGLRDRDPVDEVDAASSNDGSATDGTLEGGATGDAPGDGANDATSVGDGTPPNDGGIDQLAVDAGDAGVDSGSVSYEGVLCGMSICDAAVGCCVGDASCQSFIDCVGQHAGCDGPEDCTGGKRCCSASAQGAAVCNAGGCVTYRCNRDEDCTFSSEHKCCPEPAAPQYGRCVAGPTCD